MIKKLSNLLCIVFLWIACHVPAWGNRPDTIKWNGTDQKIDLVKQGIVFSSEEELSPEEAWLSILKEEPRDQKATVGFTDKIYWIAFVYKNEAIDGEDRVLEIDNPHIDYLSVYTLDSIGQCHLLTKTGDKLLFLTRPIAHRNFAIPLRYESGESKTILIKIDKRNSSLSFPTYLWEEESFYEKYFTQNLWFGLFFGIITLCLSYALMAFIFLKKSLYGWYFLLVFTSAASLFSLFGYSFQYLYPNVIDFNGYFRAYIQAAFYVCMVKFSQQYLNLEEHQPLINRLLNYILIGIGLLSLAIPFSLDFMLRNNLWIAPLSYSIYFAGFLLFVYGAIRTYKKQPVTVGIYFLAWGTLLIGYIIWIGSSFGFIPVEKLRVNPVLIGSSLEMFIFSIGLTYQISKIYNERNQLSLVLARQQKDLLKAYVEGTEKERQRISRELHDDIGSRLGSLKRFMTGQEHHNSALEKQIDILCHDVRNLSHQLAPTALEISDFRQLINQLLEEVSRQQELKTEVQFYDIPKALSPEITHHLFRMTQEAITNVLKHAHASELDLQFFGYDNEMVMTIEDNGNGFDPRLHAGGIGLQNMKARAESINGTIEINSSPGNGTCIMIKVPV